MDAQGADVNFFVLRRNNAIYLFYNGAGTGFESNIGEFLIDSKVVPFESQTYAESQFIKTNFVNVIECWAITNLVMI